MGYDKLKAKKKKRRIPERQLFFYAFIGGSLGAFVGMRAFRHKTQHPSFQYGIPAIFVFNFAVVVYLLKFYLTVAAKSSLKTVAGYFEPVLAGMVLARLNVINTIDRQRETR